VNRGAGAVTVVRSDQICTSLQLMTLELRGFELRGFEHTTFELIGLALIGQIVW